MADFYHTQQRAMLSLMMTKEITALLVTGLYLFSPTHRTVKDIPTSAVIDHAILTHPRIEADGFYADDLVFPNTQATDPPATSIIFVFSNTGVLVTRIDDIAPITPNGENIHIQWNGPVYTF